MIAPLTAEAQLQTLTTFRRPEGREATDKTTKPDAFIPQTDVKRTLAPLVITPSFSVPINGETDIGPSLTGQGAVPIEWEAAKSLGALLVGDVRLTLNQKPSVGTAEDVGRRIRASSGTGVLNLGLKGEWFPTRYNRASDRGSLGVLGRVAVQGAVQSAATLELAGVTDNAQTAIQQETFGLVSIEGTAAVYLFHVYLGLQWNRYWMVDAGAVNADLRREVHARNAITVMAVAPFLINDSDSNEGKVRESDTLYLQVAVTTRDDWSDAAMSFGVAASFDPL
ncbi:hypothetical protein [Hyalangium rubrum]|uniref:Transporter n=1 Tax=Hyalangium rubrum TaxID=3103134 RepID=A0ABU5H0J9_9BACT|nr:hypothetical protein [Hyalangium sp. s54d21]MDY7226954.1 hypothetical protein [Hyalangium sp. s54d21]